MQAHGRYAGWRFAFAAWTVALFVMLNLFAMIRTSGFEESKYSVDQKMAQLQKHNSQLQQQIAEIKATLTSSVSESGELVPSGGIGLSNMTAKVQDMLRGPGMTTKDRRLLKVSSVATTTNTATSGCFALNSAEDDSAYSFASGAANTFTFDGDSENCRNSNRCPPCFIATSLAAQSYLSIQDCSSFSLGGAVMNDQAIEFTIINADPSYSLDVYFTASGLGGAPTGTVHKSIPAGVFSTATCFNLDAVESRHHIPQWLGATIANPR